MRNFLVINYDASLLCRSLGLTYKQGCRTINIEVLNMKTEQRLTEAYQNARIEYFDSKSKYVFFSDCHRGDGRLADDFSRNQNTYLHALDYYYKNGFVYVEAGDGDELWENPSLKTIRSAHFEVFETIKKYFDDGRLIMLYGNHNIYLRDDKYVEENYFSYYDEYREVRFDLLRGLKPCEALLLKHSVTGQEILTVHGHQGDFGNDQFWVFSMLSLKYFWRFLHAFGVQNPSSPVKNAYKRHKIEKNFIKWIEKSKIMLICGHTHRYKYPKSTELPYFNTGCCVYPSTITAIEIEEDAIRLVRWRVVADHDGKLIVDRKVLRGPDPLEKFNLK